MSDSNSSPFVPRSGGGVGNSGGTFVPRNGGGVGNSGGTFVPNNGGGVSSSSGGTFVPNNGGGVSGGSGTTFQPYSGGGVFGSYGSNGRINWKNPLQALATVENRYVYSPLTQINNSQAQYVRSQGYLLREQNYTLRESDNLLGQRTGLSSRDIQTGRYNQTVSGDPQLGYYLNNDRRFDSTTGQPYAGGSRGATGSPGNYGPQGGVGSRTGGTAQPQGGLPTYDGDEAGTTTGARSQTGAPGAGGTVSPPSGTSTATGTGATASGTATSVTGDAGGGATSPGASGSTATGTGTTTTANATASANVAAASGAAAHPYAVRGVKAPKTSEMPIIAGNQVKPLQEAMLAAGLTVGPQGADGKYGPNTQAALLAFAGTLNPKIENLHTIDFTKNDPNAQRVLTALSERIAANRGNGGPAPAAAAPTADPQAAARADAELARAGALRAENARVEAGIPVALRGTNFDPRRLPQDVGGRRELAIRALASDEIHELRGSRVNERTGEVNGPSDHDMLVKMRETVNRVNKSFNTNFPVPNSPSEMYSDTSMMALGLRYADNSGVNVTAGAAPAAPQNPAMAAALARARDQGINGGVPTASAAGGADLSVPSAPRTQRSGPASTPGN